MIFQHLEKLIKEVFCKSEVSQLLAHEYQECRGNLKLTIASYRLRCLKRRVAWAIGLVSRLTS